MSFRKLLNFIYSKKVDGIYLIITIFGIKIITTPIRLQLRYIRDDIGYIQNSINNIYKHIDHVSDRNSLSFYTKNIINLINNQKINYEIKIDEYINMKKKIMYPYQFNYDTLNTHLIAKLFKNNFIYFNIYHTKIDAVLIFGLLSFPENMINIEIAIYMNIPIFIFEDGFISALSTWANNSLDKKYIEKISFTFSNLPHFFGSEITTLEYMLNDNKLKLTKYQIDRSKKLIKYIIENKITKYNHQPIYKPNIGTYNRKKILVVDQSYGDMSIVYGNANEETFKNMLKKAIDDNPNCDILIKTHPDSIAQNTTRPLSYFSKDDIKENVYLLQEEINPISILEIVDKVYVVSSQLGFEALMMGKEVHVFGIPFYSGYGLTIDYQKCERRTNKRTLEEMFFITYIMYSYYVNPLKEEQCEIEDAIDYLIKLRKEYFLEFNIRCDDEKLLK